MFKDTKSHSLVSLQFLYALNIFFGGNISLSKNALTELYYNISFETLIGSRDINFDAISDLTAAMSFQMKHSTPLNLRRKSKQDKKSSNDIKNSHEFFKKPGDDEEFKNKIKEDLFKVLECIKTDNPYVEPTVQNAETIGKETKKEDDDFIKAVIKFNETDTAALEQKKQEYIDELFYDLAGDNVLIFIFIIYIFIAGDYLFDSSDEQKTEKVFVITYLMILTRTMSYLKIFKNQNL